MGTFQDHVFHKTYPQPIRRFSRETFFFNLCGLYTWTVANFKNYVNLYLYYFRDKFDEMSLRLSNQASFAPVLSTPLKLPQDSGRNRRRSNTRIRGLLGRQNANSEEGKGNEG